MGRPLRKCGPRRNGGAGERFPALLAVFGLVLVVVAGRLVWMQAVAAPAFAELAEQQRLRETELAPKRGAILDREGEQLAVTTDARTVFATPYLVEDKKGTARALAETLGGDAAEYERRLGKETGFVYIERKVDMERASAVEDLQLAGVGLLEDSKRSYPSGELACHILGFVGVDDMGLAGIEKQYDELLAGTPGRLIAERDPFGRPIPGGLISREEPVDGSDLVLTIDKDIQYEAQLRLAETVEKWRAASGSVVVMDPRNGEVLALASTPGFDPNRYGRAKPQSLRNRPVTDTYEPGSTVKSLTAAAVLEEGLLEPDSVLELPPTLKLGGRTIKESHPRGTVRWTLAEIVTNSSNVGAVKLGQALGEQGLYDQFARFGLTERTGIDFPGEAKGWLPPVSQWSASSIGNIPFGQGVSVTPLQLARALAAIANGGELVTPHLLLDVPARPDEMPVGEKRRALSPEAAAKTSKVLEAVVTEGTGDAARVSGYTVAGKTGTAQKARKDGRGYAGGGHVGSFCGYLPAEDPRLLIVVTVDTPRKAIYGGVVAAPAFAEIARFAAGHLRIPPTGADETAAAEKGAAGPGGPDEAGRERTGRNGPSTGASP
ncbi:MAG: penicillin-binding protein 2 [Coriobacteriia bacterium]|nr:penicillin-binding protein 2 [Coriobacteriia bacterium]